MERNASNMRIIDRDRTAKDIRKSKALQRFGSMPVLYRDTHKSVKVISFENQYKNALEAVKVTREQIKSAK
jgi:hypothetical protein